MNLQTLVSSFKSLVIGPSRHLNEQGLFHRLSLVALLAWVGLGADGLSSSCYGPEETYRNLGTHTALALVVGTGCVITILVICAGYSQIIELFPNGGGGYLVASKLLSPGWGVVSGSALLVDYVLTIAISVASGTDALFSVLPPAWHSWKAAVACGGVLLLALMNLRGVRESVMLWAPVFFLFIATHGIAILYALLSHLGMIGSVVEKTSSNLSMSTATLGGWGTAFLILKAYSMGAGTYTGIEAVSNGLPILREPRVRTGKKTMLLMGISLATTVFGLLLAYLLYDVTYQPGKTLNAVLFENITATWPVWMGGSFIFISMLSATALLFIAAQAGFLDGPRVLANMAQDRWFPGHFSSLSDRFVAQNGILLMGGAALVALLGTGASVGLLVVLYSINVFITFSLSQLGMVLHWWKSRHETKSWISKLSVNGVGLILTTFILISLCAVKFTEGGWITLLVTASVALLCRLIKAHYLSVGQSLSRLDDIRESLERSSATPEITKATRPSSSDRTAVVFVNGYNGLGLHTFLGVIRLFPSVFSRMVFVQVGAVDAGTFKGIDELENLRNSSQESIRRYRELARSHGFETDGLSDISHDVTERLCQIGGTLSERYPGAVFFGGKLAFIQETRLTRFLHNHTVQNLQTFFCARGLPFVVVPVSC